MASLPKWTEAAAYDAGVRMARDSAPLNPAVMAAYMGAPRTSVARSKRPDLWDACQAGYRRVIPDAEITIRRPTYSDEQLLAAATELARRGGRFSYVNVGAIVGCSRPFWASPKGEEIKPQLRERYEQERLSSTAPPLEPQDPDDPDPWEGKAPCGRISCLNVAPESAMKKFPNTAYLCPECQQEYLQAVRRDGGVLAA